MRVFLDGDASTFGTERSKSPNFRLGSHPYKGHSFRSELVSAVTPSGVVPGRDRLHNADMNKGLRSVQGS